MAIIPGKWCEDCEENGNQAPAEHELDSWGYGSGGGGFVCDDCLTRRAEQAHEAKMDAYYGGSSPQTVQEHYDAAARERRELRKRD